MLEGDSTTGKRLECMGSFKGVFLGDHYKNFVCRRCLMSYTSENMLLIHKLNCKINDITAIRTSPESHLYWKKHFQKKPLYLRKYAHFEADKELDNSGIRNKTTSFYKHNPVLNGYHIESELEDFSRSAYYKYTLGYNNVDWFVNEVIYLENKMAFYSKNTKKDIIMSEKDEEGFKNDNICRFCEKIY